LYTDIRRKGAGGMHKNNYVLGTIWNCGEIINNIGKLLDTLQGMPKA
jgi:hypothetical protein